MGHGANAVFNCVLASGATTPTNGVDLGRAWQKVHLYVPTMASGSLYVQGSHDNATFARIYESDHGKKVTSTTLAAGQLLTTAFVYPHPPAHAIVNLATFSVDCNVYLQVSCDGTTFRRALYPNDNTDWSVTACSGNRIAVTPFNACYYKVELSASQTADVVIGMGALLDNHENEFLIDSSITQAMIHIPIDGYRYVKIENSSGCTDVTTTYKIICGD